MNIVGIIGAGTMGSGIAQIAASNNCKVHLFDMHQEALDKSQAKLEKILNRLIEKGRIDENTKSNIQSNIHVHIDMKHFQDCDLVIEAIVENPEIKKKVFEQVESIVSEDCIIASNTSSLSITSLAAGLNKPQRFMGIHFFNPAPLMKLVEIIPAIQTDPALANMANETIKKWGKLTVVAKDTPGFIVNRVARPFYSEALRIYEEGLAGMKMIDLAMKMAVPAGLDAKETSSPGFRMGPFELMDFIGHDVNFVVTETMYNSFYQEARYKPSFTQKRHVEAGYLGRKSGRGFYDYGPDRVETEILPNPELMQKIAHRIVIMLINEAADAAYYNIASPEDIDTAMTKGVNYPKGLLAWADELGIQHCVDAMDNLYNTYHEARYRCSPMLRQLANTGTTFFGNNTLNKNII